MAVLGRIHWLRAIVFLYLTLCLFCAQAQAQEEQELQLYAQKIKAGLVYNFLKYTEWPSAKMGSNSSPVVVCIFGREDPFEGYLLPMNGRTVSQRTISVRYVSEISDTAACHLVVVSSEEKERWPQLRSFLANKSVLTVGDFRGFLDTGGMIQFGSRNNRISVELNMEAVSAANLLIYDSLRRLATVKRSVRGEGQ